jgi:hypothetical protein
VLVRGKGFIASLPEEVRSLLRHEYRHSDGAASHFKQRYTMQNMHEEFELDRADWVERLTWTFGCPRHGKCNCDGFGGIAKNTADRYAIREEIVIRDALQLAQILTKLFGKSDDRVQYTKDKSMMATDWMIMYLSERDLKPLRIASTHVDNFIVNLPNAIGLQSVFHLECLGTWQTIVKWPAVKFRQFGVRRHACCCTVCLSGVTRDDTAHIKRKPQTQGPLLVTLDPAIPGCTLEEPWDYVHIRSCSQAEWDARGGPTPIQAPVVMQEGGGAIPLGPTPAPAPAPAVAPAAPIAAAVGAAGTLFFNMLLYLVAVPLCAYDALLPCVGFTPTVD